MTITIGKILSLWVAAIGVIMLAAYFNGDIWKPPVLSGFAFILIGIKGMMD